MVDFHCNKCNVTHANARDCPHYSGLPNYAEWDTNVRKEARDFNRRAAMKGNNYNPQRKGESAPKSGCVVIGVALVGAALVAIRAAVEVFT